MIKTRICERQTPPTETKKSSIYNLQCEWDDCTFDSDDYDEFNSHLDEHVLALINSKVELMVCRWSKCEFCCEEAGHVRRHVLFHGFHSKLKDIGARRLAKVSVPECQHDADKKNQIPSFPEPFRCAWDQCALEYDEPQLYYSHVHYHVSCEYTNRTHRDGQSYMCLWRGCEIEMSSRSALYDHTSRHTQERRFACPHCGNRFCSNIKLMQHRIRQTPVDARRFQCSYCQKLMASETLLHDHIRTHINTHRCSICGITCIREGALRRHIEYRHLDMRPFPCTVCEAKFKSVTNLRRHIRVVHGRKEALQCPAEGCSYTAWSQLNVNKHYQRHHETSVSRYHCHLCSHDFRDGMRLTKHLQRMHKLTPPQGHSRFSYKRGPDGHYRMVLMRYESLDVVNAVLTVPPSEPQAGAASDGGGGRAGTAGSQRTGLGPAALDDETAAVPDVLSLTCADRDPPDFISLDDGRELTLPPDVRNALARAGQVLVCVQNEQVQLLTRADYDEVTEDADDPDVVMVDDEATVGSVVDPREW